MWASSSTFSSSRRHRPPPNASAACRTWWSCCRWWGWAARSPGYGNGGDGDEEVDGEDVNDRDDVDDRDGSGDHQDAEDGAEAAEHFAEAGHRTHVSVTNLRKIKIKMGTGDEDQGGGGLSDLFDWRMLHVSQVAAIPSLSGNVPWDWTSQVNFISPSIGHVWSILPSLRAGEIAWKAFLPDLFSNPI